MRKLKKNEGWCAVLALYYVSKLSESLVLNTCKMHDFEGASGMTDEEWLGAAKDLGIRTRAVPIEPQRLKKFARDYNAGIYFVATFNHLLVVHNGKIVDKMWETKPRPGCVIRHAWKVLE